MKQILVNSEKALISRMPKPTLDEYSVIVKVKYSTISPGTELASLKASNSLKASDIVEKKCEQLANKFKKAVKDPVLAAKKMKEIVNSKFQHVAYSFNKKLKKSLVQDKKQVHNLEWHDVGAEIFEYCNEEKTSFEVVINDNKWGYFLQSGFVDVPKENNVLALEYDCEVIQGEICIGVLNETKDNWIDNKILAKGKHDDILYFDVSGHDKVIFCFSNGDKGKSKVKLERINCFSGLSDENNVEKAFFVETKDIGWNVGYSAVGKVVSVGEKVNDISVGDMVACAGAGFANHADYILVPRNLACKVPQGCDLKSAAMTTIGTIALQGVRRADPQLGEVVLVLGLGLLGQITVQLLKANGCVVLGMDLDNDRVQKALDLGLSAGATSNEELKKIVRDFTCANGVDKVLITAATKSNSVINLSMELARQKGKVIIVGDIGLNVERAQFYKKEIDLLMSTSYGPGRYDQKYELEGMDYPFSYVRWTLNRNMETFLNLIAKKIITLEPLIDKVASISEASKIYADLATKKENIPLGVLLKYDDLERVCEKDFKDNTSITIKGHRKPLKGKINYSLIGVGAFGTCMLVPKMEELKDFYFLKSVVSKDAVRGGNYAKTNRIEKVSTNFEDSALDKEVDLLVIATRHCEHAKQVVKGLKAGKNIFVEKPLALNWQELNEIVDTYNSMDEHKILMVGFNRRFSPAMQLLKKEISNRRSPLMINYRLNGGYIPVNHWIQLKEQGGGRNLGEACHMYDCFKFLTDSNIKSIQASSINPDKLPYLKNDNFSAILTYQDGSVANLFYTALGNKGDLSKEYVEVYCDGKIFVIEDYKSLTCILEDKITCLWRNDVPDKGHFEQLKQLALSLKNADKSPIIFEDIVEVTSVALSIEEELNEV